MFASLELKAIILAVAMAGAAFAAGILTHKVDNARYLTLEMSYAKAQEAAEAAARAEQQRLDGIATAAAEREAQAQTALADTARRQLNEVRAHVKKSAACVRVGLVRVLVAGSRGVLADSLPLPAGLIDDACSGYSNVDVASAIVGSLASARANSEQLDALIQFLRDARKP